MVMDHILKGVEAGGTDPNRFRKNSDQQLKTAGTAVIADESFYPVPDS